MIKAFFVNWGGAFRDSWGAARALPWLVALMIGIEFAQHMVELQVGFFSPDSAVRKAAGATPIRMAFAWPKMLILYAVGFMAMRYYITGDARDAVRPTRSALRRYVWVVLFQLVPAALSIHSELVVGVAGGGRDQALLMRTVVGLGQQVLEPLLFLWFVSAAMGTDRYGPISSAKTTRFLYLWALPVMFLMRVPLGLLHQMLHRWSIGQAPAVQYLLLTLDAVVVGVLALALPAVQVRIARFIVARRGAAAWETPACPVGGHRAIAPA
ncbi:hypothetical protein ACFOKI_10915 [Sphingomonas qilianensis]|uniref:Uncharacterized protein n=1 Tax=Sphingomonas qilianensis TaxID=1736690 RepID=A0ABU9XPK2_9SPHN